MVNDPATVYLDAGVIVGAIFSGTPDADACRAFCEELADARARIYFSQVVRLDYAHALRRLATKPDKLPAIIRTQFRLDRWGSNPLVRQLWFAAGLRQLNAFLAIFGGYVEVPLTTEMWEKSLEFMAVESLDARDAMHLAVARTIGISDFATTDGDFRRIQHPRIHLIRDASET